MDHDGKTERRHKNPSSYQDKETPDVFYTYHRASMKCQVTEGHPSVKTWHGWEGFPGQCHRAFTTVGEQNSTRRSTHCAFFLRKRRRLFWWPKTKGGTPSWRSLIYQTSSLLSVETIWTLGATKRHSWDAFLVILMTHCAAATWPASHPIKLYDHSSVEPIILIVDFFPFYYCSLWCPVIVILLISNTAAITTLAG